MSVKDRDPLTGHKTTGHEWDGIAELNTRVPRAIWFFVIVTHLWALVVWVLLPTWPLVHTYTKGLLGLDQREEVRARVIAANASRADWATRLQEQPAEQILANPELMARVNGTARQLFGDNCAGCHGRDANGGPGFPSLIDGAWLWGGDTEAIMETLRVGINAPHPETRFAQMMAFGADGILSRAEVRNVVSYVQSLSGTDAPTEEIAEGAEIFAANCASCHGDDGRGNTDLGAPNLADESWIYGGDHSTIYRSVWGGREGWMPSWEGRLSETERKILAVYLQGLEQAEATQ